MKIWFKTVPRFFRADRSTTNDSVVVAGAWPDNAGRWRESRLALGPVNLDAVGDCVVIRAGVLIAAIGNVTGRSGLWSSCVRTWLTLLALRLVLLGKIDLEALIGSPFAAWVKWKHVLSRVSNSVGPDHLTWRYSGGNHWPWLHRKLEAAGGAPIDELLRTLLLEPIRADLTPNWEPDNRGEAYWTIRVDGSPYEMAKLGLLMQRDGVWNGQRLFDAGLWRIATGGGVNGDGVPNRYEGWQTHLVKDGMHSDGFASASRPVAAVPMTMLSSRCYFAAGGVNRGYVFVDPDREVVVARARRSDVFIDQFLPELYTALGFI